jgi:LPS export ABC transporter permease LptF/LPS export ABC transporter permease LptG
MRILRRYILHEVVSHALIGAAVFTFVLFTRDLGRILELVARASAPLPSVAEIFFYTVPVALTYTLPMAVLVGILIGLSRLAADSEITAMRACGIGVWNFLGIISWFVLAGWLLALVNGVYVAPRSQAALGRLQERLKTSQVSFEIKPRVFYEGFPKAVLYVQDVKTAPGAALWKGVFLADTSDPASPRITLAQQGVVLSEGPALLHLHLTNGSTQESDPKDPGHYAISTFQETDIPIPVPANGSASQQGTAIGELDTTDLLHQAAQKDPITARWYMIEFHRRFALPTACVVLALVGIPLGLSSKRGGKSSGFVLTIILVFAYYSVSLIGVSLARQGRVSPAAGVWMADLVFFVCGAFLLWHAERRPIEIWSFRGLANFFKLRRDGLRVRIAPAQESVYQRFIGRRRDRSSSFPTLLDDYVLREFLVYLAMIVGTFLMLLLVFTLFELLGDILRNQVHPLTVIAYLLNVSPFFLYNTIHLSVLLAVLVTFGLMQRANETIAIKATGISIYRVLVPIALAAAVLAGGLFFFDQLYLPTANQRQDALRNQIKGKPPQTYLRPDRKWIFGEHSDIYYYQLFDPDRDQFGSISIFQFDPQTFEVTRRIYASRAHWEPSMAAWVFEQGWERQLRGAAIENFRPFDVTTFPQLTETPAYFKIEVKQSLEMNYQELSRYIHDLQQSGFDVVRLRVQLQEKLAFPLMTLVMAVLAIPFSLSPNNRGAVGGVALAVTIAVVYTVVSRLFEAMGNLSQLPPALAAWSPDLIFGLLGGYLILKVPT